MALTKAAIIVTGTSGALGSAIAADAGAAGADLFPVYRSPGAAGRAEALAANDGHTVQCDVTNAESVTAMVRKVIAAAGKIDGIVNVVGGWDGGNPVSELDLDRWQRMIDINLTSTLLTCRAVLPSMLSAGYGRIVNIASEAASRPSAGQSAYNVANAGVVTLTRTIAEETANTRVTANAISPRVIDTPENRRAMPDADTSGWTKPEHIASVVTFLLSRESGSINGASIPVGEAPP